MRLKLISCEVFLREFCHLAAMSRHLIDMVFHPFGLHDTPNLLREEAQKAIDATEPGKYDYILLGYGLCSRGTAGLVAREVPLVLPRAHDCITLFLGSRDRYDREFSEHPGTYYYSSGWVERKDGITQQGHVRMRKEEERQERYRDYVRRYGEDNARYLLQMETEWLEQYRRAAFINVEDLGDVQAYRAFAREMARTHGWEFAEIPGDAGLIRRFVEGEWDEADFLIVRPGQRIRDVHDPSIVGVEDIRIPDEGLSKTG
jgi:hypothetical protein